jgi:ABC-type nickel/cobalt efflux system permease component RcnA
MVGIIHSILPDHWVPLAVVARTQGWSLGRLARVTTLAAAGHVLISIALGGVVALIGLQFQKQIETQQGHIVGGVLVITGVAFLVWGLTGHGHAHEHGSEHDEKNHDEDHEPHQHEHPSGVATVVAGSHEHEHAHAGVSHSHRHNHDAFIEAQASRIAEHSGRGNLVSTLAAIAVPFGVAASPDLTFLPLGVAASAYGVGAVLSVLGVFAAVTMTTFVGLTLIATAAGYQMRGEWLEVHANTITSGVLIVIGVVAFVGL